MGDKKNMRSILEQSVIHHLNGDTEKAKQLFHEFVVARARQIHESMRNGEDPLVENFDEETVSETYFGEDDLAEVEDDVEGDEGFGDEVEDAGDEVEDDLGIEGDDEDAAGDFDFDAEDGEGEEGDVDFEERLEDLQAELERLTAEFEDMQGGDDAAGDFDDDVDMADDMQDDMGDEQVAEGDLNIDIEHEDDDFEKLGESITSELEKVTADLKTDGKEVGAGGKFAQQKRSTLPQKGLTARQGGEPVTIKSSQHKGFERETAPSVADMKKRRNTLAKSKDALGVVPSAKAAEGKEVGAGGKTTSVNTKSPTSGVGRK
jgi:hypothetical protein